MYFIFYCFNASMKWVLYRNQKGNHNKQRFANRRNNLASNSKYCKCVYGRTLARPMYERCT